MRRGYSTLFIAALAVTLFVNPMVGPPGSTSAPSSRSEIVARASATPPSRSRTVPVSSHQSQAEAAQHQLCDDGTVNCPETGLLDTIQAAFGPEKDFAHWNVPPAARQNLRFIIATVPDPIHTRLGYIFDRQIDAIQEAVQANNYLFARSWMPWDPKDHPEDTDFHIRLQQESYQDSKEAYSGLMIFRPARRSRDNLKTDEQYPLFVFLVGETPTQGINKGQFRMALRAANEICKSADDCQTPNREKSLYILGPMFSGSLYSLNALLKELAPSRFSNVTVHSGTASSYDQISWFQDSLEREEKEKLILPVNFRTFQESSDYALAHFLRLTCDEGYRPEEVAVLSEDETAYGSAERQPPSGESDRQGKACADPLKVVHLYFPRNISQLRSAYQQDLQDQAGQNNQPRSAPRSTLQTNLDDNGSDDDTVAPYSRIQTPLSQEAVMLSISSSLKEHHIQFVVLEATSSLDSLFLIRFLHTGYSQARIVTIDDDLLLPRQADDSSLHGVMAIASYPLLPGIDHELAMPAALNYSDHIDRVFPSNYSTGTFNALLSLLKVQENEEKSDKPPQNEPKANPCPDWPKIKAQCADLSPALYADYGWAAMAGPAPAKNDDRLETNQLAPALWLTVLGRNGYSPVAILDATGSQAEIPAASFVASQIHAIADTSRNRENFHVKPTTGWILLCSLQLVVLLGFVTFLWRGSIRSASKLVVCFAPIADQWRNGMFLIAGSVLAMAAIALVWPWLYWGTAFGNVIFAWAFGVVNTLGILTISAELAVRQSPVFGGALACGSLALVAASWFCATLQHCARDPLIDLRLFRYVDPGSGVSPCLPLFLVGSAVLWWTWYRISSRGLWLDKSDKLDTRGNESDECKKIGAGYGPQLPKSEEVLLGDDNLDNARLKSHQPLAALTRERNQRLVDSIRRTRFEYRVYLPPALAGLLSLAFVFPHPVRSFDGRIYDWTYWICVSAVLVALLWALFQVMSIWLELRTLLVALDRLKLRTGFERMTGFTWKPLWQLGGTAYQDFFVVIGRELDALTKLANIGPSDTDLKKAIQDTLTEIKEFAKWARERGKPNTTSESKPAEDEAAEAECAASGIAWYGERVRPKVASLDSRRWTGLARQLRGLQDTLALTAARALRYVYDEWQEEGQIRSDPEWQQMSKEMKKGFLRQKSLAKHAAEDFLCLFYFNFISAVFMSMRSLIMMVAGMFVFVLLSFTSYPFEPRLSFRILMVCLFALIVSMIAYVFAQMHRDPTLSRITNTKPGELGIDFWIRLTAFVSVPLFSLLASVFPSVSGFLFSWLQPATQAFK